MTGIYILIFASFLVLGNYGSKLLLIYNKMQDYRLKYIVAFSISIILAIPFINIAGNYYSVALLFFSLFDGVSNITILLLLLLILKTILNDFGLKIPDINPLVFVLYLIFSLIVLLGNMGLTSFDITHTYKILQAVFVAIFMIMLFFLDRIVAYLFLIALMFNMDNIFFSIFDGYLFVFSLIFSIIFGIKLLFKLIFKGNY